jgi:hypothetical protein
VTHLKRRQELPTPTRKNSGVSYLQGCFLRVDVHGGEHDGQHLALAVDQMGSEARLRALQDVRGAQELRAQLPHTPYTCTITLRRALSPSSQRVGRSAADLELLGWRSGGFTGDFRPQTSVNRATVRATLGEDSEKRVWSSWSEVGLDGDRTRSPTS